VIEPLLGDPDVEFVGEINDRQKRDFLGRARALIFPIDWPEPFGLVMIEAMACGTPVLALRRGSVAEIIDNGLTGFVIDDMAQAQAALRCVLSLDRRAVRDRFEERFTVDRMAADYIELYGLMAQPAFPLPVPMVATGAGERYPAVEIAAAAQAAPAA
jgi:glycosyltransferase involved in cell wall biosynthesis